MKNTYNETTNHFQNTLLLSMLLKQNTHWGSTKGLLALRMSYIIHSLLHQFKGKNKQTNKNSCPKLI